MSKITPEQIDELLPQTQCGLCGYGGCMPYAEAMVFEGAAINLCPPGGVKTLHALGNLLQQDATPYLAEMEKKAKPEMIAVIREAECIGCTKCIQACPVDAILGSAKQMHTVIAAECTGCELCVAPCPVDCIDIVITPTTDSNSKSSQYRQRFYAKQKRINEEIKKKKLANRSNSLQQKKDYIAEAIARAKRKKMDSL